MYQYVFTPCKIPEEAEIQGSNVKVPPSTSEGSVIKCSNCDEPITLPPEQIQLQVYVTYRVSIVPSKVHKN